MMHLFPDRIAPPLIQLPELSVRPRIPALTDNVSQNRRQQRNQSRPQNPKKPLTPSLHTNPLILFNFGAYIYSLILFSKSLLIVDPAPRALKHTAIACG
ncbi:MAG: hypothetical protein R3276_14000 [Marinobacter sp.]|nr:hypothetical protein [Marinobacter sp.]